VWSARELHRQHPFISGPRTGAAGRARSGAKSLLLARLEIPRTEMPHGTVPFRTARESSWSRRAQRAVMALRRDPSWLCGARRQMEGITSRESDVQEPRAKRADRGREDSHGRPKEEERNIASSKRTVPIRAGGLGHPGAIRHPATSPRSSVATQSTVIPHAGAAWWSWSCERTERKRFFFPHQIVVMLGASRPSEQLAVENP
jgi:hypothetical protein